MFKIVLRRSLGTVEYSDILLIIYSLVDAGNPQPFTRNDLHALFEHAATSGYNLTLLRIAFMNSYLLARLTRYTEPSPHQTLVDRLRLAGSSSLYPGSLRDGTVKVYRSRSEEATPHLRFKLLQYYRVGRSWPSRPTNFSQARALKEVGYVAL